MSSPTVPESALPLAAVKPELLDGFDVLIIGSGPIGAVFARKLVKAKKKVLMIEMGEQASRRIGDHKKNSVAVQKNISLFTHVVKGDLQLLSVPTSDVYHAIEPSSCFVRTFYDTGKPPGFVINGQNPRQRVSVNLPEAAASRVVGGMGSHWTCCVPRQHKVVERSDLFHEFEWDDLYLDAETMFKKNNHSFDNSIRQTLIKDAFNKSEEFKERKIESMPLACRRDEQNRDYVEWTCTATILEDELSAPAANKHPYFELRSSVQCIKLDISEDTNVHPDHENRIKVDRVVALNLMTNKTMHIKAKQYVICAGAVLTPGILFNSGFRSGYEQTPQSPAPPAPPPLVEVKLPAFGRYMTEQTMAFCQVVLKKSLIDKIEQNPEWKDRIAEHKKKNPCDPVPIPFNDPDPQCYFPMDNTEKFPWHTQIHRDAFGYGEIPAGIDQRLVVDFRWFGYTKPEHKNHVTFYTDISDGFGMPQPTFHFEVNENDAKNCHSMITDMIKAAREIGGFLPGAEPKFLPPGSALHICGTYRAGKSRENSVVNRTGKVWGVENLVLGGCGVIPTQNASNPTLTAACFAIAAARKLIDDLEQDDDEN